MWYINNYELPQPQTRVTARSINTAWAISFRNIYGQEPHVSDVVNQQATPLNLTIVLYGNDRFNYEASIRAETRNSPCIYIENNRRRVTDSDLHISSGTKKFEWLVPTALTVRDRGAMQGVECSLNTLINGHMINSCDFIPNANSQLSVTIIGGGSITIDTDDKRFGYACLKSTGYTSTGGMITSLSGVTLDLSDAAYFELWAKFGGSTSAENVRVMTDGSNYYQWDLTISAGWHFYECLLSSPTTIIGSPSLSAISAFSVIATGANTTIKADMMMVE